MCVFIVVCMHTYMHLCIEQSLHISVNILSALDNFSLSLQTPFFNDAVGVLLGSFGIS